MLRQPAAARADVDPDRRGIRERLEQLGVDRLVPRELVPLLRLEVVNEGPEKAAHHALAGHSNRHASHLVVANRSRQPGDVLHREMPPAGRRRLDCLLEVHLLRFQD